MSEKTTTTNWLKYMLKTAGQQVDELELENDFTDGILLMDLLKALAPEKEIPQIKE